MENAKVNNLLRTAFIKGFLCSSNDFNAQLSFNRNRKKIKEHRGFNELMERELTNIKLKERTKHV